MLKPDTPIKTFMTTKDSGMPRMFFYHPKQPETTNKNICAYCSAPLDVKKRNSIYCSRRCSAKAVYSASLKTKKCPWCNSKFTTKILKEVFCSRTCEAKYNISKGRIMLMADPWQEGLIPPDCCDREYFRYPDNNLGF